MPLSDDQRNANSAGETPPQRRRFFRDGELLDSQVREAMERGDFDDLPGKGKPLQLDPRTNNADAIVAGILKEANAAPEWVHLSRRIDQLKEQLAAELEAARSHATESRAVAAALLERWRYASAQTPESSWLARWRDRREDPSRIERELRQTIARAERRRTDAFAALILLVHDINRRTRRYNLTVPVASRQRGPLTVGEVAADFVRAWPSLILARDGEGLALKVEPCEPPRPSPPSDPADERRARDPAQVVALTTLVRGRRPPPIG
jgi:hypothetical protein